MKPSKSANAGLPAFHRLVEAHGRELYAYLWRLLGDRQDAEDCLQDTYLRAFGAYGRTTPEWNHRAWLYKIATNVARTHFRKASRRSVNEADQALVSGPDPQDRLAIDEQIHRVRLEVKRLSFRQRTALMMRKYSGLDYEEIAEALDCTPETARAHVYQGLKRLRERLLPEGGTGGKRDA